MTERMAKIQWGGRKAKVWLVGVRRVGVWSWGRDTVLL